MRIKNFCRWSNLIFCCIEDTCCVGSFYDVYKRCGSLKEGEALMMHVISFCGMESMVMFAELYCLLTANNFIKVYIMPFCSTILKLFLYFYSFTCNEVLSFFLLS